MLRILEEMKVCEHFTSGNGRVNFGGNGVRLLGSTRGRLKYGGHRVKDTQVSPIVSFPPSPFRCLSVIAQ